MTRPHLLVPARLPATALALACLLAAPARAHQLGMSYLDLAPDGADVQARLTLPAAELSHAARLDANADGVLDETDLAAVRGPLEAWLLGSLRLAADGRPCDGAYRGVELREPSILRFSARFRCAGAPARLSVRSLLPDTLGAGHATAVVATGPVEARAVLPGDAPFAELDLRAPARVRLDTALAFAWQGVHHIFGGYDHVLFLLSLVLLGGTLRRLVALATAFTLAHSVTLALAATGVLALPGRFVETAIAVSIAYVAAENWRFAPPAAPGAPEPAALRLRWLAAFAFGLVHGFGFAGALAGIGLPAGHLPLALAAFNVGVEAGQVAILAAAWPLLERLSRTSLYRPRGVRAVSAGTFAVALYWALLRAWPAG